SEDPAVRTEAASDLVDLASPQARALLMGRLDDAEETDSAVRGALQGALKDVNQSLAWGEHAGVVFTGISLGSILLLAALGLAITYGLMGVIHMAHGARMMIGAYATLVVQNVLRQ